MKLFFLVSHASLLDCPLMVNCWFGAFSGLGFNRGTPKNPNPFHFRGFQESKPLKAPNQQPKPLAEHLGRVFDIGDYTTQLFRDYNKPL